MIIKAFTMLFGASVAFGGPAMAQSLPIDPGSRLAEPQSQDEGLLASARTADAGAGEIGQRQERGDAAPNVEPLGRIDNRIENRLRNRLRNRVDRDYDPMANATSPFERADKRARESVRTRPRS